MNGTRELETGRLRLRRYRMEDAGLLHQYFGIDEKMYEYSGWNPYATPEMAKASVREFIESYDNSSFYGWAIELKKDSDYVFAGTVGAYDYDPEAGTAEVGLSVRRDLWGRGIAGESLKAVIEYLTCQEKIPCILPGKNPLHQGLVCGLQYRLQKGYGKGRHASGFHGNGSPPGRG